MPPAPTGTTDPNAAQLERQFEDIVVQSQNLEHYEKLFQQVLVDLENDDVLETFRIEYESLHNSFLKCHEGEKKLIKKCTDLNGEINSCSLKVRAAEELSQGDRHTIEQLKKEIQRARQRVAQSREAELSLKEKTKQLRLDIKELDNELKRAPATVLNQDGLISELMRKKLELQKILDTDKSQLVALLHDIQHYQSRCDKATDEKRQQENQLNAIRKAIELKMNGVTEQRQMKDAMEKEVREIREELIKRNKQYNENQQHLNALQDEVRNLEEETLAARDESERFDKDLQTLMKQYQDKKQEFDDCTIRDKELETQIQALMVELKTKESELHHARREVNKHRKIVDGFQKRNIHLDEQKGEMHRKRDAYQADLENIDLEIASMAKLADTDQKQVEDLTRERDILNKNYLKAVSATQRQSEWLQVKENQRRNLDHQLRGYEREAQRIRERTLNLTRDIAKYTNESMAFEEQRAGVMDKIRDFKSQTDNRQKDIGDTELKLRQQLALLDAVTSERNLLAKNFLILRQEISEMTQKELGTQSLIENLNTELKKKESQAVEEETKIQQLHTEKGKHDGLIDEARKETEKKERMIAAYSEELLKLNEIIAEADAEKSKQKRDHLSVMNERDILGTQLIQRNDELAKLYENIRIQQSGLKKGEVQYGDRLRDIQQLTFRIEQLGFEFETMRSFASRIPELKLAVNKATRELTQEQGRVRMLLDECDNPRNVHRFTLLQGSEPHTEELFFRVKEMQQELLKKNSDVEEKDRQIADMEKLYLELKAVVARQPGPEVAEQLSVYQQSLDKKTGQLKAMKESLRQFSEHVQLYQGRYNELRDEMKELSSAYVNTMKQREKEIARERRRAARFGGTNASAHSDGMEVYVGYTAPPRPQTEGDDGGAASPNSSAAAAYAQRPAVINDNADNSPSNNTNNNNNNNNNNGAAPAATSGDGEPVPPRSAPGASSAGGSSLPDLDGGGDGADIPEGSVRQRMMAAGAASGQEEGDEEDEEGGHGGDDDDDAEADAELDYGAAGPAGDQHENTDEPGSPPEGDDNSQ